MCSSSSAYSSHIFYLRIEDYLDRTHSHAHAPARTHSRTEQINATCCINFMVATFFVKWIFFVIAKCIHCLKYVALPTFVPERQLLSSILTVSVSYLHSAISPLQFSNNQY